LAISSLTASQANAVLYVQTVKMTSGAKTHKTVQPAGDHKIADTVTISKRGLRTAEEADNGHAIFSVQSDQKDSGAEVNNIALESGGTAKTDKPAFFQQAQRAALQVAANTLAAARDAAAAKAAKSEQTASEAKAAAAEQKGNAAKAAAAAQAVAAAQNDKAALAIVAAQAANAAQYAADA